MPRKTTEHKKAGFRQCIYQRCRACGAAADYEMLQENYMPYAMSVIISRALPEIDGFKAGTPEAFIYYV